MKRALLLWQSQFPAPYPPPPETVMQPDMVSGLTWVVVFVVLAWLLLRLFLADRKRKQIIECFIDPEASKGWAPDVVVVAQVNGEVVAAHVSSNAYWAKHDIGLTSDWKHETYKRLFPNGYDLVWLDSPPKEGNRVLP